MIGVSLALVAEERMVPFVKEVNMRTAVQLVRRLQADEEGATLVEYTVLLGIMLVAVITTIGLVGGWMSTKWTALYNALSTN
jgi:pilus assembly protein Flp/PilA